MSRRGIDGLSSHRAFRWAVAAWFAALLGGGLFIMPPHIHRALAERVGMGALPDETLRLAAAAAAAALGFLLGLAIAGRGQTRAALDLGEDADADAPLAEDAVAAEAEPWEDELLAGPALDAEFAPAPTPSTPPASQDAPARLFNARDALGDEGIAAPHHLAPARESDEDEAPDAPAPAPAHAPASRPAALGDLTLAQLTARLERAMTGTPARAPAAPAAPAAAPVAPPEQALRSALDKLSRFPREG